MNYVFRIQPYYLQIIIFTIVICFQIKYKILFIIKNLNTIHKFRGSFFLKKNKCKKYYKNKLSQIKYIFSNAYNPHIIKIRQGFDKPCRLKVYILLFFYQVCKGCHTCIAGVVAELIFDPHKLVILCDTVASAH